MSRTRRGGNLRVEHLERLAKEGDGAKSLHWEDARELSPRRGFEIVKVEFNRDEGQASSRDINEEMTAGWLTWGVLYSRVQLSAEAVDSLEKCPYVVFSAFCL